MDDNEKIEVCKDWIATRRAWLDQREKWFEEQYPLVHPFANMGRLNDLEVERFRLAIHEYELDGFLKSAEEDDAHA